MKFTAGVLFVLLGHFSSCFCEQEDFSFAASKFLNAQLLH